MDNRNLNTAKTKKYDEFYTTRKCIDDELVYYERCFNNKIVYCNTDSERSNFWKYFVENFDRLGLKKLIATYKGGEGGSYLLEYNGFGTDIIKKVLVGDGSYDSVECLDILNYCDVVVTNPPFSIFGQFIKTVLDSGKKFLLIGSINAFTADAVFPYYKMSKFTFGITKPRYYEMPSGLISRLGITVWYTNLNYDYDKPDIVLTNKYSPDIYKHYDNYDAINVNKTAEIPKDYDGVMGVPMSLINKLNDTQFKIFGVTDRHKYNEIKAKKEYINPMYHRLDGTVSRQTRINLLGAVRCEPTGYYYTADNIDYPVKGVYKRLLIVRQ